MSKTFRIPLLFLLIAGCLGLLMRYMISYPVGGITFTYILHAHSHVMFLGWVFNMLALAFIKEFADTRRLRVTFWLMQIPLVGMLLSFPFQGYALYSILFSSLHTFLAFVFIAFYLKATVGLRSLAVRLSKASLLFFAIASIAPFFVGYLKTRGLEHSDLYRFAIYFYLHFQYNGCFFFGVISLLISLLQPHLDAMQLRDVSRSCVLFFIAAFPAYVLSTLWASPGTVFNVIGFFAGVLQVVAFVMMARPIGSVLQSTSGLFTSEVIVIFKTVAISLAVKLVLQLISSSEEISILANEYRSIVIAYLHLMLVGVITLMLFAWLVTMRIISASMAWATYLVIAGFTGSELLLILVPVNRYFSDAMILMINKSILILSLLMLIGIALQFLRSFFASRPDPDQ